MRALGNELDSVAQDNDTVVFSSDADSVNGRTPNPQGLSVQTAYVDEVAGWRVLHSDLAFALKSSADR